MRILKYILGLSLGLLMSCQNNTRSNHEIYLGCISGPEAELMQTVQSLAKTKYDLKVKIVHYLDYVRPNAALSDGSIDANLFQHQPYLDHYQKQTHSQLVSIGRSFVYPMGLYSKKHQKLDLQTLPMGSRVGIPVDPSNAARALLLLARAKLIRLTSNNPNTISKKDISDNPKQLQIVECDAAMLPRLLEDFDLAAINTNYALPAGLVPSQDALLLEDKDSQYANILVIRAADQAEIKYQHLLAVIQSNAVKLAAAKLFGSEAIPVW